MIGNVHVILAFLKWFLLLLSLLKRLELLLLLELVLRRWLSVYSRAHGQNHSQISTQANNTKTLKQYNKASKQRTKLD
jgi:hypothetical protein